MRGRYEETPASGNRWQEGYSGPSLEGWEDLNVRIRVFGGVVGILMLVVAM